MPVVGREQALYAKILLLSAAMIQEIVSGGEILNKFTLNGKNVWAQKFIPSSSNNISPSY